VPGQATLKPSAKGLGLAGNQLVNTIVAVFLGRNGDQKRMRFQIDSLLKSGVLN